MSPLFASVAAGMTAPTFVPAVLFSATSRVAVAGSNTGALLPVREPSTLWPDCSPSAVWARFAAVLVATLVIAPAWGSPLRSPTRVRSWSPIQMPLSSPSLDTTV